ncbi:hypothetical protein NDU88_008296 [Pleurodeles waltl]|uniref:Uncharacterized protein n=1 Tax=Pleurodeles waltl TaxID=8319 RepID=A0AAV7RVC4_PLEWA|nr:hypothetical protein NDU88_008296 [Pleurodeles waltl]
MRRGPRLASQRGLAAPDRSHRGRTCLRFLRELRAPRPPFLPLRSPAGRARSPPFRGHLTVFRASATSTMAAAVSHCFASGGSVAATQLSRRLTHRRYSDASWGLRQERCSNSFR